MYVQCKKDLLNQHACCRDSQTRFHALDLYLIANINEICVDGSATMLRTGRVREWEGKKCHFNERHSNLLHTQSLALLTTVHSIEFSPIRNSNVYFPFVAWNFHTFKLKRIDGNYDSRWRGDGGTPTKYPLLPWASSHLAMSNSSTNM